MLKSLITQLFTRPSRRSLASVMPTEGAVEDLQTAIEHHQHGRHAQAESAYRAILERNPHDVEALHFSGNLYVAQGRLDEALPLLERAALLSPGAEDIRWHLGLALYARGRYRDAARTLLGVAAGRADAVDTLTRLKDALLAGDQLDDAEDCCRALLNLTQGAAQAKARSDLGTVLLRLGRVGEALDHYMSALDLDAGAVKAHSNLLYAMHYHPGYTPEQIFAEHRHWAQTHTSRIVRRVHAPPIIEVGSRRIRVGYVSPDFCHHPVSDYVEPVLRHHDRSRFEVYCYSDVVRPDQYTERLRALHVNWRDTASLSDAELAERVLEDRIDILVDLAGHTRGNRLLMFAGKPSPVQVTWLGHPNTTGLAAMDYRITDALTDPPGMTDHLYTEVLARLPDICVVLQPPAEAPEVNPLPAITQGYVTFGSFNALQKVTPEVIAVWARILVRQPRSRLIMLSVPEGRARVRLQETLAKHGVDPGRVEFRGRVTFREFHHAHHHVDVALDPFPCAGHSTSFLSLWMGVPLITLAGGSHVSRFGVTVLSNVGLERFIARDAEEYVAVATAIASNLEDLSHVRATLRQRMRASPGMDVLRFMRGLEETYQHMWDATCNRHHGEEAPQGDLRDSHAGRAI